MSYYKHPNDNHGGALKGAMAQSSFEATIAFRYPKYKLEKTERKFDVKGVDYVVTKPDGVKMFIGVTSNFEDSSRDHLRLAVGAENSKSINHIFNSKAEWLAVYNSRYDTVFLMYNVEKLKSWVLENYGPIESMKRCEDKDYALQQGILRKRVRAAFDTADLSLYIPLKKISHLAKEIEFAPSTHEGVIK